MFLLLKIMNLQRFTIFTKPSSLWCLFNPNTRIMKPLPFAVSVVACNHWWKARPNIDNYFHWKGHSNVVSSSGKIHFINNVLNFSSIQNVNVVCNFYKQKYHLLLMESIHKSRHEKHQLLTFGVEFENNAGGFFSFLHYGQQGNLCQYFIFSVIFYFVAYSYKLGDLYFQIIKLFAIMRFVNQIIFVKIFIYFLFIEVLHSGLGNFENN